MRGWFLFVALLILGIPTINGQDISLFKCETFDQAPGECRTVLGTSQIWVSPVQGITQEFWVSQSNAFFQAPPFLSPECSTLYLRLICPTALPTCLDTTVIPNLPPGVPPAVPRYPCNSVCQEFLAKCDGVIPGFSCSIPNPINLSSLNPSGLLWPDPNQVPFGCVDIPADTIDQPQVPCPDGLEFYPKGDPKTLPASSPVCAMPCKDFLTIPSGYLSSSLHDQYTMVSVLSGISLLSVLFGLFTFLLFPQLRAWPRRIVTFVLIGMLFEFIALVGNITYTSVEGFACDGKFEITDSGWCEFSGWSLIFGSLVVLMWWMTQAVVLFWNVALMKSPELLAKFEIVFHIVNWTIPLMASFVLLGENKIGGLPGYPWCFIRTEVVYPWVFYFAILLVMAIMVSILIISVMIRLAKESTLKQTVWTKYKYQIQLGAFALYFDITVIYITAARLWLDDGHIDALQNTVSNVYTCLFLGNGREFCSEANLGTLFPSYLAWSQDILVAIQGMMVLIIFLVLNEYNRNLWVLAFRNWQQGRSIFYTGTGTGASTGSSGSSGSSSDDPSAAQRRENRAFRRQMEADKPEV